MTALLISIATIAIALSKKSFFLEQGIPPCFRELFFQAKPLVLKPKEVKMKLEITENDVEKNIKNENFCKMLNSVLDYEGKIVLDEELNTSNKAELAQKIEEWKSRYSNFDN